MKRLENFGEAELPNPHELISEGRRLAQVFSIGASPFLETYGVESEVAYKERRVREGAIMLHAQVGYRDPAKSRRAFAEIYERLAKAGHRVDRYGLCLDWSMGYPKERRGGMPRGTGLILEDTEDFVALTQMAPVAPHFGDFVIGMPAAVENTAAALAAGSTSIGNLGQYFTFRLPHWDDDVTTTAETIKAIALAATQSTEVLIHSNLDDGFAALFCDLACALGAVLIEQYVVEELIGGHVSHCYGHTYSEPYARFAFQRALASVATAPGTMIYGNTTAFGTDDLQNYASLAGYLTVDVLAQQTRPTGHALNPVPVTEAVRIPEIEEIVDAHVFANRLIERVKQFETLFDVDATEGTTNEIVAGGYRFRERVFAGLVDAGVDIENPVELLLALRRIGAKRLEEVFGPGSPDATKLRGRAPIVQATTITELEANALRCVANLDPSLVANIRAASLKGCVATTDVHEYGKILVESVLRALGVNVVDAGVSTDPERLAERARSGGADFIALSTYNGVALDYIRSLNESMRRAGLDIPIFIGGKLNQIPTGSNTSLPVDVSEELESAGAVSCATVESMLERLPPHPGPLPGGRGS